MDSKKFGKKYLAWFQSCRVLPVEWVIAGVIGGLILITYTYADGVSWTIDECYVSYYCKYKGQDFLMITYEMIKTAGDKVHTTNMIFLPPLGIRVFQLPMLLPYAVQASGVLANKIHNLWELLLAMKKADPESVFMEVSAGKLVIEDEK